MIRCKTCLRYGITRQLIYVGGEGNRIFNTGYVHADGMDWFCFPKEVAEPVPEDLIRNPPKEN